MAEMAAIAAIATTVSGYLADLLKISGKWRALVAWTLVAALVALAAACGRFEAADAYEIITQAILAGLAANGIHSVFADKAKEVTGQFKFGLK